jgi:hypothetical protein
MYNEFECCVLHNGQLTPGVRQGCFLIFLDEILRRSLDGRRRGILWKLIEHLEDLDYAYGEEYSC